MAKSGSVKLRYKLYRYMKERRGLVWPDEAARELGVSIIDVLETLRKLEREGSVREAETLPIEA